MAHNSVPWLAILREHTGGLYHGTSADDCGVPGDPPNLTPLQLGQAEEGSSTALLVVGATNGLGR